MMSCVLLRIVQLALFVVTLCAAAAISHTSTSKPSLRHPVPLDPKDYEPPQASEQGSGPNTDPLFLEIKNEEIDKALTDNKNRVSDLFKVPAEIRPTVKFWFLIYTKFSSYQTLLYDKDKPEIIYEVIDNRDLLKQGLGPVAIEVTSKKRLISLLANYQAALTSLQRNPRQRFKTGSPGARLLQVWGKQPAGGWKNVRAGLRTQPGQRDQMMVGIGNAERFFPAMELIFKKQSIPPELTRIPLVESSFNLNATSKAQAVGVWQFLEKSATEYLVVDPLVKIDERRSPIKSTYAAARMFKRNHKLLKDWGMAVVAYNHGPKNLLPLRSKYSGDRFPLLVAKTRNTPLGYASRNFYCEFLAALHAEKYRDVFFGYSFKEHSEDISIVKMKRPASIFEISLTYNISIQELRVFNPDIFDLKRKLPSGTRIVIPRKHGESLVVAPQVLPFLDVEGEPGDPARAPASDSSEPPSFIEYVK